MYVIAIFVAISCCSSTITLCLIVIIGELCVFFVGGVDFADTILTTTFITGSTTANVTIPIADDAVVDEKNETINLTFNIVPTEGVRVKPGTRDNAVASATAIIIDTSMLIAS